MLRVRGEQHDHGSYDIDNDGGLRGARVCCRGAYLGISGVVVMIMPQHGQFIAVWKHPDTDELYASTLRWQDGELYCYQESCDRWLPDLGDAEFYEDEIRADFIVNDD